MPVLTLTLLLVTASSPQVEAASPRSTATNLEPLTNDQPLESAADEVDADDVEAEDDTLPEKASASDEGTQAPDGGEDAIGEDEALTSTPRKPRLETPPNETATTEESNTLATHSASGSVEANAMAPAQQATADTGHQMWRVGAGLGGTLIGTDVLASGPSIVLIAEVCPLTMFCVFGDASTQGRSSQGAFSGNLVGFAPNILSRSTTTFSGGLGLGLRWIVFADFPLQPSIWVTAGASASNQTVEEELEEEDGNVRAAAELLFRSSIGATAGVTVDYKLLDHVGIRFSTSLLTARVSYTQTERAVSGESETSGTTTDIGGGLRIAPSLAILIRF